MSACSLGADGPEGAEAPDRELMRRVAAGDRDAMAPLVERHHRRLYRIALSYLRSPDDALDCVQETFVKAFRAVARWDPRSEPAPWLTRIAVNEAIDRYRRGRRRLAAEQPLAEGDHDVRLRAEDPSPERRMLSREVGEKIDRALRTLPERHRAVFVLRHYEQLSLEQIAETLGVSLGTVKSSLHRAIHRLRERLHGLAT